MRGLLKAKSKSYHIEKYNFYLLGVFLLMSLPQKINSNEKFCSTCGNIILKEAEICPKCGIRQIPLNNKSRTVYILLGLFLGCLGVHNFYAGYNNKGIIQLLLTIFIGWTGLGLFLIAVWALKDILTITEDSQGNKLV